MGYFVLDQKELPILPLHALTDEEVVRIDAVRGFLCFYVLCFHFYATHIDHQKEMYSEIYQRFFHESYIAVRIFFALSGFLIFHSYSKLLKAKEKSPVKIFYIKRFFRIAPVWLFVLTITIYESGFKGIGHFLWNFFFLFGFKPFYFKDIAVLHSWSLYLEEMFYLFFPAFIFVVRRKLFLPVLILFLVAKVVTNFYVVIPPGARFYSPFNNFHYFGYGILAYIFWPYFRHRILGSKIFYAILGVLLVSPLLTIQKRPFIEPLVLFWFVFIAQSPLAFSKYFSLLFRRLGIYCFSLYMIHPFWIHKSELLVRWLFPDFSFGSNEFLILSFSISLLTSILGAMILYYTIERWGVRLGQAIIDHLKKQPTIKPQRIL